jgi:hypothetical protein
MSEDVLVRFAVVVGVAAVAATVALIVRRGTSLVRRPIEIPGYGAGVYLFTSSTCSSCEVMASRLSGSTTVVSYDEQRESFPGVVRRVPALAALDEKGRGWIAYGVIGRRRIDRWLRDP